MGLGQCKGTRKSDEVLSFRLHFYLFIVSSLIIEGNELVLELQVRSHQGIIRPRLCMNHDDSGLRGKMEAGWARMNGDHSLKHDVNQF